MKYAVAYEIAHAMKYAAAYGDLFYFIFRSAENFIIRRLISYRVAIFHYKLNGVLVGMGARKP